MTNEPFLFLWGKTDRQLPASSTNFHPLLFHLLDVAYCAEVLWSRLPPSLKRRMAQAVRMSEEDAGRLFVLLAGLHDLGKAFPGFQKKVPELMGNLSLFDFPSDQSDPPPHNFVSVPEVMRLFAELALSPSPLPENLSLLLSYSLGAHHGVFPNAGDVNGITNRRLGENSVWREARNWLASELRLSFPGLESAMPPPSLTEVADKAFAPLLAALISLADWFGSSRSFPIRGLQELPAYRKSSQACALQAVSGSGWVAPPPPPAPADFPQLFSFLKQEGDTKEVEPNALQKKVLELLPDVSGPAFWIIEEEMGAGKTESAFSIFDDARVKERSHGVYVAMPTQATSNAMYSRLGKFLRGRVSTETINLILAHSHALLDANYLDRMKIAEGFTEMVYNEDTGEQEGALLVRSWFTQNKQTLLAHYGVGTIDQALMGVLQTRHWFVRLFGLAGKTVVFDEVHAYDAYMNTLLSRLIEWLAELDCTVVLLSATLPQKTRLDLAEAYAKGAKATLKAKEQAPYPRITRIEKGNPETADAFHIEKSDVNTKAKTVLLLHLANSPEAIKAALLAAIPDGVGGCGSEQNPFSVSCCHHMERLAVERRGGRGKRIARRVGSRRSPPPNPS
ncbi:MAG: CRISPR-associated endonuclease Cas3'' [Chthonomonadaceae bacterium]|nr:CRISPR-associated endonuclease Cas3'' [Chthonomonadaceae bacterium]